MQGWVRDERARVLVIFDGRDAAGKGSAIKRVTPRRTGPAVVVRVNAAGHNQSGRRLRHSCRCTRAGDGTSVERNQPTARAPWFRHDRRADELPRHKANKPAPGQLARAQLWGVNLADTLTADGLSRRATGRST
jgi:hypothetical protein